MKNFVTVTIFLFIFMAVGSAIAGENLEQSNGWKEYVESGTVSFVPNGEKLAFSLEDDPTTKQAWGKWYQNFPGAYGAIATFKVDSFSGNDIGVGLRKVVGLTNTGPFSSNSGNPIQARINLGIYENKYRIQYQVRERTPTGNVVQYFAKGVLGDYDGMWKLGDQVTIGLAVLGQDVYFYTPSVGAFTKVQLIDGMSPITSQYSNVEIEGWVWNTDGKISGEISDLTILGTPQANLWNSYIGYWTGVVTNASGATTNIAVSIWGDGVGDWRAQSSGCNGVVSGYKGTWGKGTYSLTEPNGSSTMTINFINNTSATITVQHTMDC